MAIQRAPVLACAILALALPLAPSSAPSAASAPGPQSHALVFAERDQPDTFVLVEDFRVNDTITNPEGDRFFMLWTPQGTFELPFESVAEVEFTRFHGMEFLETAMYDVRVVLPLQGVRRGVIELRNLRGMAGRNPWHHLLMTRRDTAQRMHRILFVRRD